VLNLESFKPFLISDELTITEGKGGLPELHISNEHASAVISIYAAQVLSYQPKASKTPNDLLFVSNRSFFERGEAIRGGIPVCWPWFGKDANDPNKKRHGFARLMLWDVIETKSLSDGATQISLSLSDTEETLEIWPHRFHLTLTIVVGNTLKLSLKSENTGNVPFIITQALHTYFSIDDIDQVSVEGLDQVDYLDKASVATKEEHTQSGLVTIGQEVDRIYTNAPSKLAINDLVRESTVGIESIGSKTAIVWNPWAELSKKGADLEDEAYQQFICVETANAVDDAIEIAAGDSYVIGVEYTMT